MYFWGRINDRAFGFARAFALQGTVWLVYAAAAPSVAAWGLRFRIDRPPRAAAIAASLAGVAAVVILFAGVGSVTDHWLGVTLPHDPLWQHLRNSLIYRSPEALITYGATVGAGYAAESTRRARELARLEAALGQAQLEALRSQLHPHFLFNALHTIAAVVREHDERQAVELIERLGDVLRHVLRGSRELEVPLAREVDFLAKYLAIEQARFGDRLAVSFAIDGDAADARVPQLIVQPLVENALRHGLAPRAEPGRLAIAARRTGDLLRIEVADDGLGLRAGWDTDDGVGLPNVRARLARMYGPAGRLALASPASGGVVAVITLPYRRGDD
ncbi:MAG TPA: histidine kinase [Kofleriaceae bacterium]|jgi:LytS/YehU family sensor histidine kinase|nr:histidine kinase [Kofleriaceae bacterium]